MPRPPRTNCLTEPMIKPDHAMICPSQNSRLTHTHSQFEQSRCVRGGGGGSAGGGGHPRRHTHHLCFFLFARRDWTQRRSQCDTPRPREREEQTELARKIKGNLPRVCRCVEHISCGVFFKLRDFLNFGRCERVRCHQEALKGACDGEMDWSKYILR